MTTHRPVPLDRANRSYAAGSLRTIRELILAGHFEPGQRLNEVEIARSLGVSRGPVREALQRLATEGLVELVPNRGAFVCAVEMPDIQELYEVREALEVMAVRLCIERATESDIQRIQDMIASTREALGEEQTAPYPLDKDLHRCIGQMARNSRLEDQLRTIDHQLHLVRTRSGHEVARAHLAYEEHLAIADAITARDVERAEHGMRSHLRASFAHVKKLFDSDEPPEPRT